jgi:hypothetical protein
MAKLYTLKNVEAKKMKPKKETISFILNYSKALTFITAGKMVIENIAN